MSRAWMIASGKGGVGKTTATASLATALARRRRRVVVVDADLGLRNLDLMLGLQDRVMFDLVDYVNKNCTLEQALVWHGETPQLALLPAAQLCKPSAAGREDFARIVRKLKKRFDYVLVDCPAGIGRGLSNVLGATDGCILVTTPDDTAMRDAERVAMLMQAKGLERPRLLVNRVSSALVREGVMCAPEALALALDLPLVGAVPEDAAVYRALLAHENPMDFETPAARALTRIAARLDGEELPIPPADRLCRRPWYHFLTDRR